MTVLPAPALAGALCLALAACAAPPSRVDVAPASRPARQPPALATLQRLARGARFDLPDAVLFVPEGLVVPADGVVPLFVHFQGGVTIAEENFARSARPGVLVASRLSGRSSAFSAPYRDPAAFRRLLAAGEEQLRRHTGRTDARFGAITITFFSAGYGAVRELLEEPAFFERITALVSADSIYADVLSPAIRVPPIEQMKGFIRFAQAAARGTKTFVLAHSAIATDYATTRETADMLIACAGARREPVVGWTQRGVPINSRAHVGSFWVYGFDEAGPEIHVDCLWMIDELCRAHLPGAPRDADQRPGMVCRPAAK